MCINRSPLDDVDHSGGEACRSQTGSGKRFNIDPGVLECVAVIDRIRCETGEEEVELTSDRAGVRVFL